MGQSGAQPDLGGLRGSRSPTRRQAVSRGVTVVLAGGTAAMVAGCGGGEEVSQGLVSALCVWQGPSDDKPNGVRAYYANNLIGGGPVQQKSNGAYFKNGRAALRKLNTPPRTAENTPGLSEKQRSGSAIAQGVDGNPASTAKNLTSVTVK